MENIERLISEENAREVREILTSLRTTLDGAGPRVTRLLDNLESSTGRLDEALDDVPLLTERVNGLVADVRAALGPDGQRLAGALDSAQSALDSADEALTMLGDERTEIALMTRDLRDTVANLKAFSQQVKERPFSLVRIKSLPDRRPGEGVRKGQAP